MKTHSLSWAHWRCPIIVTVRDRYDTVVSAVRRHHLDLSDDNVERQARELLDQGYRHLKRLRFFPRVKILRYEDFIDRPADLLCDVARFLGVAVSDLLCSEFERNHRPEVIRQVTAGKPFPTVLDPETQLHGSHISASLGRPGEGRRLTKRQRHLVDTVLGPRSLIY